MIEAMCYTLGDIKGCMKGYCETCVLFVIP